MKIIRRRSGWNPCPINSKAVKSKENVYTIVRVDTVEAREFIKLALAYYRNIVRHTSRDPDLNLAFLFTNC